MTDARTTDLSPTWPETVEILLAALENGRSNGKAAARAEIRRMAQILDQFHKDQAERITIFEVITKRNRAQPYGVTFESEEAAKGYLDHMRAAGYTDRGTGVIVVKATSAEGLAYAAEFYRDPGLVAESGGTK